MRNRCRLVSIGGLSVALVLALSACAAKSRVAGPKSAAQAYQDTPVPTVPPSAPTPQPGETSASPIPTHPVGKPVKARKGEAIGPVITFFGAARADGTAVEPQSVDKKGIPTYVSGVGSGFMLVVEGKPGLSGYEPARRIFAYVPGDPTVRPDLEIETTRNMGDGSPAVCDRTRPNIGGIPGINPPSFRETQRISDAINDLACRFETFIQSDSSCTQDKNGDYSFVEKESTTQFCMIVARAWAFPAGETLLSVRLRDSEGNPGPVKQMRILRPVPQQLKK
ncbi:MAG: hypothetical protein ACHQ9S_09170 [Candidatus Binatia bacterium]